MTFRFFSSFPCHLSFQPHKPHLPEDYLLLGRRRRRASPATAACGAAGTVRSRHRALTGSRPGAFRAMMASSDALIESRKLNGRAAPGYGRRDATK